MYSQSPFNHTHTFVARGERKEPGSLGAWKQSSSSGSGQKQRLKLNQTQQGLGTGPGRGPAPGPETRRLCPAVTTVQRSSSSSVHICFVLCPGTHVCCLRGQRKLGGNGIVSLGEGIHMDMDTDMDRGMGVAACFRCVTGGIEKKRKHTDWRLQ